MTLRIHAPNPMRVGETANVLVTSDNPGAVSLVYGAGLTGPATVTIEGERVWRNGLKHGQYLARATSAAAGRKDVSWCLEVDYSQITPTHGGTTLDANLLGIFSSVAYDKQRMLNWHFSLQCFKGADATVTYRLLYNQSNAASASEASFLLMSLASATPPVYRFVVTAPDPATDNKLYCYYTTGINPDITGTGRVVTNDTMGGNQAIMIAGTFKGAKFARMLSQAERQVFVTSGTLPATPEISYQGGHEIDPAAPVFWDTSGNNLDLTTALNIPTFPPAAASGDFTDTSPVIPYAIVPVTAIATTDTTIDATRPRQGVPARASEAEKTETADQVTVTVEAPLVSIGPDTSATVAAYPADVYLQVCATPDGAVSLASDDTNLTVPETVEIVGGSGTVTAVASADVTGATITATYGATTDTATVSVTEAPEPEELLAIGPDTVAEVESYPAEIILLLTSNVDGDVEIASDNENLIPVSPVTVIDGKAEVACLVTSDVTGATVTASRDPGPSDSCSVSVSDVLTGDWIACGPNQRTRIEGKRIVWPIRVRSSKDGAFTATADPSTGIIISGPFELASGACDITAQPTQAGTWTLTVEQDGRTDSVTLQALAAAALPVVKQYNLSAEIDAFFDFINRKYGFRPRFTPANVQDVRAEHATDRTYSRYAQGTGQPGSVFGAVALSYQVMISYSSATMAEQDLGILREEADRYGWNAIGFSMTGQTMFEPVKMMPRLTLTLNFDIIPQGR